MASSIEETKSVRQPLSDRVRDLVEQEYLELHLAEYQYGDPNIRTDPASRAAPSKYAKTSSTPSKPPRAEDVRVGKFSVRIYWPDKASSENKQKGCAIWWRGGGYCMGNESSEEHIPIHICNRTFSVVVSVQYRLAPDDPYPAGFDDAYEAFEWVLGNERFLEIDNTAVVLVGQSAGGTFVHSVGMRYGMTEAPIKILASVTAVAICDNTATPMSATWQKVPDAPVVGFDRATQIQEIEFGPRGLPTWRAKEWKASPALAPLEVLRTAPETLMIVAGVDLYYGENNEFYEKLKEAGVPVVLKEWPRAVHSFLSMDAVLPSGKEAMDCLITFIKEKMTQHFLGSKTQDCYR